MLESSQVDIPVWKWAGAGERGRFDLSFLFLLNAVGQLSVSPAFALSMWFLRHKIVFEVKFLFHPLSDLVTRQLEFALRTPIQVQRTIQQQFELLPCNVM